MANTSKENEVEDPRFLVEDDLPISPLRENGDWAFKLAESGLIARGEKLYTLQANQTSYIRSPRLDKLVEALIADIGLHHKGKPGRKNALLSLLNALFIALDNQRGKHDHVGVLWATNSAGEPRSRYKRTLFTEKHRKPAAEILEANGLITFYRGRNYFTSSFGRGLTSLVLPTEKTADLFELVMEDDYFDVITVDFDTKETVILKGGHKGSSKFIDYVDNQKTEKERLRLQKMNNINCSYRWTYEDNSNNERVISISSLSLSRHFHYERWDAYGRIHCGAQGLRKEYRRRILIDGLPTVELDYKTMSAALLYAHAGLERDGQSYVCEGDAYAVSEINGELYPRELVKLAFQTALNNDKRDKARKAITKKYPNLHGASDLLSAIEKAHPKVEHLFYQEIATSKLFMMESNIMADILDHAIGWEIPLLPIHDGLVCREEDYPRLSKVMSYAFERRYAVKPKINLVADNSGNKELLSI